MIPEISEKVFSHLGLVVSTFTKIAPTAFGERAGHEEGEAVHRARGHTASFWKPSMFAPSPNTDAERRPLPKRMPQSCGDGDDARLRRQVSAGDHQSCPWKTIMSPPVRCGKDKEGQSVSRAKRRRYVQTRGHRSKSLSLHARRIKVEPSRASSVHAGLIRR